MSHTVRRPKTTPVLSQADLLSIATSADRLIAVANEPQPKIVHIAHLVVLRFTDLVGTRMKPEERIEFAIEIVREDLKRLKYRHCKWQRDCALSMAETLLSKEAPAIHAGFTSHSKALARLNGKIDLRERTFAAEQAAKALDMATTRKGRPSLSILEGPANPMQTSKRSEKVPYKNSSAKRRNAA